MAGATEARAVGERLRAVRRLRQLSLEEVERRSGGRWSASAVGAYERGFRTMTLLRLRELAEFYDVPVGALLGLDEVIVLPTSDAPSRVALDIEALAAVPDARPVLRFAESIAAERADAGTTIAIRASDVRILCSLLHLDEAGLTDRLRAWGALVEPRAARR